MSIRDLMQKDNQLDRWVLFAHISFYTNLLMAVGKVLMGIYTLSLFLCINALYNVGMALARIVAVKGYRASKQPVDTSHPLGYGRNQYLCFFRVGMILAITSVVYIIYCSQLFFHGSNAYYSEIMAITIAAISFTEVGARIYGICAIRKYKEPAVSAIKMANLASALISLVLTQTAILSFAQDGEVSFFNGLIGVIMGTVSALIGAGMMLYKLQKYSRFVLKKDRTTTFIQ